MAEERQLVSLLPVDLTRNWVWCPTDNARCGSELSLLARAIDFSR